MSAADAHAEPNEAMSAATPSLNPLLLQEIAQKGRLRGGSAPALQPQPQQQQAGSSPSASAVTGLPNHADFDDALDEGYDARSAKFGEPDSAANLLTNDDGSLRAGSLIKIIEKISSAKTDVKIIFDFLLTYRTYAKPAQLLSLLQERFLCPPPAGLEGPQLVQFTTEQTIIRLKVVNIVKHWIERHWYDWISEEGMDEAFISFIELWEKHPYTARMADQVRKSLEKRRQFSGRADLAAADGTGADEMRQRVFNSRPPPPDIPLEKRPEKLDLESISIPELARQMTLIEWDLWENIKAFEFLSNAWTKKDKEQRAPAICLLIKHFNYIASWVATSIVSLDSVKDRVRILSRFVELAQEHARIANFNAVMEILSGLGNSGVFRLKQTWEEIPPRIRTAYNQLKDLMSPEKNFAAFREQLKLVNPPTIPYIGIFLTDLIYINDGSKDFITISIPSGGQTQLINFSKCRQVAQHIQLIMQYQQAAYNFQLVPIIEDYLLHHLQAWDDESIYSTSQYVEPRPGAQPGPKPDPSSIKRLPAALLQTDPRDFTGDSLVIQHSQLVAATLMKLVRHILYVDRYEGIAAEFLSTYRAFTVASKFLRRVASILKSAPDEIASPPDGSSTVQPRKLYKSRTKKQLVRRLSHFMSMWFVRFANEIVLEQSANQISEWLQGTFSQYDAAMSSNLVRQLDVHTKRAAANVAKLSSAQPAKPIAPSNPAAATSVVDFSPVEAARQMAMHVYELFRRVTSSDIFDYVKHCGPTSRELDAKMFSIPASLRRLLEHRTLIRDWLRQEVATKSTKKKTATFEFLLSVLNNALEINDFCLIQDLYIQLMSTPFADVWPTIPAKLAADFQKFKDLFNGANDREALRLRLNGIPTNTPALPPLGWLFDELNTIRSLPDSNAASNGDAAASSSPTRKIIYFAKYRKLSSLLQLLDSFKTPYNFSSATFVVDYIRHTSLEHRDESPGGTVSRSSRSATVGYGTPPPMSVLLGVTHMDVSEAALGKAGRLLSIPLLERDSSPSIKSAGKNKSASVSGDKSPRREKPHDKELSAKRRRSREDGDAASSDG